VIGKVKEDGEDGEVGGGEGKSSKRASEVEKE